MSWPLARLCLLLARSGDRSQRIYQAKNEKTGGPILLPFPWGIGFTVGELNSVAKLVGDRAKPTNRKT